MLNKILNFMADFGERTFTAALIRDAMAVALLSPPSAGLSDETAAKGADVVHLPERPSGTIKKAA